jgi:hypothetical protein
MDGRSFAGRWGDCTGDCWTRRFAKPPDMVAPGALVRLPPILPHSFPRAGHVHSAAEAQCHLVFWKPNILIGFIIFEPNRAQQELGRFGPDQEAPVENRRAG